MADGKAEVAEWLVLKKLLSGHPILNYVQQYIEDGTTDASLAQSYKNTIDICREIGRDPEYPFFVEVLESLAKAGVPEDDNLVYDVVESFKKNIAKI
jgi:hypothetical protein